MGPEMASAGTGAVQATRSGVGGSGDWDRARAWDEPARQSLGLFVTEDRVLIRADQDDHAPQATAGGLYVAPTMASAVEGSDARDAWYTGRVMQVGPQVGVRNLRRDLVRSIRALEEEACVADIQGRPVHVVDLQALVDLRIGVERARADMPDPIRVGQRVAFSWQVGHQLTINGLSYVVLRASDVLAVIEDDAQQDERGLA